jgi:hypothetical protein
MERDTRKQPDADANKGEGNPEAAARFNEAEQQFVKSAAGQQKIRAGAQVRPEEAAELMEAERKGRAKSKDENPEQDSMDSPEAPR